MPSFEQVVICFAGLVGICVMWVVGSISFIAFITWLHGGHAKAAKYPQEWVKYHREMGGW
jgi:hypothetical protein